MKIKMKPLLALMLISVGLLICFSFRVPIPEARVGSRFPYLKAGLTESQAAAQLLSRLTFGAAPGQVDEVVKMGLENWFQQQLNGNLPDDSLDQRLTQYDALSRSNREIVKTYLGQGEAIRMAIKAGYIEKDSADRSDKGAYKEQVKNYMVENGYKPEQELYKQLINNKILTAVYSRNQLQQVLADFWFNHFNVSITKNSCAPFILSYERDVIRPNATGKFGDLLLATAKSPAMLYFLDNFSSSGDPSAQASGSVMATMRDSSNANNKLRKARKPSGINENYAREVMELHTLGVDGGYTQQDVTQAARILTGWTVVKKGQRQQDDTQEGDFQFLANRHDQGAKKVLNFVFEPGGSYEEGVKLMQLLAHHPSTAKFITYKLAVRFVSDNPPKSLLNKMAKTFLAKDGDIKAVLLTMVSSPEFWSPESLRGKTKSPFELAISAVRSLDADVQQPYQLFNWINKMGQKVYYYQAPTGFPDRAQYWISTGALLSRMNFGLALSMQRIPGIRIDLRALNGQHEPESPQAALTTYSALMMPGRNLTETIKRLTPLLNDPSLISKVDAAAARQSQAGTSDTARRAGRQLPVQKKAAGENAAMQLEYSKGSSGQLAQVVGMVIGSPEFQRR
jgi:uncharacterized protein (DUF1800 family)